MSGFRPGDDSCALHRYEAIVQYLDSTDSLTPGDRSDLEYELLAAMGSCAHNCVDRCLADTFLGSVTDSTPHTRHPEQPSVWIIKEALVD